MDSIQTSDDIKTLAASDQTVVLVTYRGFWCPFCIKYLWQLNEALRGVDMEHTTVYGISVDEASKRKKVTDKLDLNFELLQDSQLLLNQHYDVTLGKKVKGRKFEPYLQPAVFIFREGQEVYRWIQTPKLRNLGGATHRVSVDEVLSQLRNLAPVAAAV